MSASMNVIRVNATLYSHYSKIASEYLLCLHITISTDRIPSILKILIIVIADSYRKSLIRGLYVIDRVNHKI